MLNRHLSSEQLKVIRAIRNCRTAALGGHVDECDACDFMRISYNSCRNRHCPKCQTLNKERWIEARKDDLLNVGYFHIKIKRWCMIYYLNPLQKPYPSFLLTKNIWEHKLALLRFFILEIPIFLLFRF